MTRNSALCLSLVFAAGAAFADDITIDPVPFVSTASRAQVQEELRQFRAAGVDPWSDSYNALAGFKSSLSRGNVMAEFSASRGEVAAFAGEDSGSTYLARANASQPGRAMVLAGAD